jgi:phosphoserine phosphatase
MTTVCFDTDGTLIHQVGKKEDTPRYQIIELFHIFQGLGYQMFIWSGGGVDYAERWRDKLGLDAAVVPKGSFIPDIAVDDEYVKLGKVNLKV